MTNGYLDHASYFLCQMDRQKLNIPRNLLDLFLEFSLKNLIYEKAEEQDFSDKYNDNEKNKIENNNKFDQYDPNNDPDYVYYFAKRNHYKKRNDMKNLFSALKVECKPFFPKSIDNFEKIKTKLSNIDPKTVKEFIPKSYKILTRNENQ